MNKKTSNLIEHYIVSTDDPQLKLYVRERTPTDISADACDKAIIFIHGATLDSGMYDLPVAGYSWLQAAAGQGMAAYAMDVRGYGNSTRPPSMASPAGDNLPYARATDAVKDIGDVVNFVRARTGRDKVILVGGSWGSITAGAYTSKNNDKIEKLVLYAPVFSDRNPGWLKAVSDPDDPTRFNFALGAYRRETAAGVRNRWDAEIVPEDKHRWREDHMLETLVQQQLDKDPESFNQTPPDFRVPNGVLMDVFEIFSERPLYNPSLIQVPTMLVRGAGDPESTHRDATGLFEMLGSQIKRYVVIGNGSHFLFCEKNGFQAIREVLNFVQEEF